MSQETVVAQYRKQLEAEAGDLQSQINILMSEIAEKQRAIDGLENRLGQVKSLASHIDDKEQE